MGTTGARWWAEGDVPANDASYADAADVMAEKARVQEATSSKVVELSADSSTGEAGAAPVGGKMKKSRSGLFKGLGRKKKSSSSLADEADSQPASESGITPAPSGSLSEDFAPEPAKEKKKGLFGLGRKKKSSCSLTEVAESAPGEAAAEAQSADGSAAAER